MYERIYIYQYKYTYKSLFAYAVPHVRCSPMLTFKNLTYRIAGRTLIEDASAQISDGQRVGLIGRNGTGKSTLLKLILGEIHPDAGDISKGAKQSLGSVSQEAPDNEMSLADIVMAGHKEMSALWHESESATDAHRISEIHERLNDLGAHSAPAKAARILAGLGFSDADQQRSITSFSGGWRMRVNLASALFAEPDILLLDEPTNHLDLEASLWLEAYLIEYPHMLIIVSHDRELLNKVPQRILHLDQGKLTLYTGGYDTFERVRRERMALQQAQAVKQQAQRDHMQKFVDRFRAKASKAKQAQSRLKMLERMEPIVGLTETSAVGFQIPDPEELPPPVIHMENCSVGYDPDVPILKNINLRVDMDDRIALLGANGNGKTTFLRLLSGRMQTLTGSYRKSGKLRVGYFAQNQLDELDASLTPISQIHHFRPKETEQQIRSRLGAFGFSADKAQTLIKNLSGGEKARLAIACICLDKPQILLLDEPTNHLDIDSRQALIQALTTYSGAVILVSHDPHLVNACADSLWMVTDGTCKPYDGDLDTYKDLLMAQRRAERKANKPSKKEKQADGPKKLSKKEERIARAEARQKTTSLRAEIKRLNEIMQNLDNEKVSLHTKLGDGNLFESDPKSAGKLSKRAGQVEKERDDAELAWMSATEELAKFG